MSPDFCFPRKKNVIYYVACTILVLVLSSFRTAPIYGKLDFIFVHSRPWWPRWKTMVDETVKRGTQPIYTDPITSIVFKGVFRQDTVFARRFTHYPYLPIEQMDSENRPLWERFPYGAFAILFRKMSDSAAGAEADLLQDDTEESLPSFRSGKDSAPVSQRLYRCVVNLQGFTPSWVPRETRHWNPRLASTAKFYRYHQNGGQDLIRKLHEDPPQNCEVYF